METGAVKLTQMYTKLVAEASSGIPPARSSFDMDTTSSLVPFPDDIIATLTPLVSFLRTLPLPATHPSHPAAAAIQRALTDAQRGYADMRGAWTKRCLEGEAKRAVEGRGVGYTMTENTEEIGVKEGYAFAGFVISVLNVAEVRLAYFSMMRMCRLIVPQQRMNTVSLLVLLYFLLQGNSNRRIPLSSRPF